MDFSELKVEKRDGSGKGVARQLRAVGKLPAVLYGDSTFKTTSLSVDAKALKNLIRQGGTNAIIKLHGLDKTTTAMIKEVQRHPVRNDLIHVDFVKVVMDETIDTNIPIELVGDAGGVKEGGVFQHSLREVQIRALPGNIPEKFELDVSELGIGDSLKISDLPSIADVEILSSPEEAIVTVVPPTEFKEEEVLPPEEEEAEEAEAAEGEAEQEEAVPAGRQEKPQEADRQAGKAEAKEEQP